MTFRLVVPRLNLQRHRVTLVNYIVLLALNHLQAYLNRVVPNDNCESRLQLSASSSPADEATTGGTVLATCRAGP
jgi:hypothetical protein